MTANLLPLAPVVVTESAPATFSPRAQTYDPVTRGPVLLAASGYGSTDATVRAARAVAERLGTSVEVAGVVEPMPMYLAAPEALVPPPDLEEARRASIRAAIDQRLEEVGGASRWPVTIYYGDPAHTLADVAREHASSLIVVGAGRRAGRGWAFGGERAARVVRAADRPVLVVPPEFHELPKTIVVGVDFSPASVRAARLALAMLAEGGRLVLVFVRQIDFPVLPTSMLAEQGYDELVERWREKADAHADDLFVHLRDELRPHTPPTATVETRTRDGSALGELLAVADEVGADMLAVGTHGPGLIERLFVGSVAAGAIRAAGRTVLVAPAPAAADAAWLELRMRSTTSMRQAAAWEPALEAFSKRNVGRRVRLEVDDPEVGAQVQQSGFALLGVSYDRHDRRVELMMGHANDLSRHLTSSIAHAEDVSFYAGPDGRDRALRVVRGRGQALLTFLD